MERKDFLKTCGFACLSLPVLASILESCNGGKMITGTIDQSDLVLPESSFLSDKGGFRKYIVVENERLKFPVCLYRVNEVEYSALSMRCPHQGAELQAFGDRLQCPAHGSEFNNKGIVQNGPADTNLRTFPVSIQNNQIHISLK
jgi:nitrite reductase/ring-hydroxylating ferredoxin subunit